MPPASKESDGSFVLEQGKRLSRSSLWRFQRQFFDEKGVDAWGKRIVPTHVTSNAFIAEAYARVVLGFLRDCMRQPAGSPFAVDGEQPVHLVELGAGTGYFSYLFITKLVELCARSPFAVPRFRYVITDFTEANLEFWAAHPCFLPLIEYGLVDMARFDAETDDALELRISKLRLAPGTVAAPMVVFANYVFDTISQDVFRVRNGKLEEGLAVLRCQTPGGQPGQSAKEPMLDHIEVGYEYRTLDEPAYDNDDWNAVLDEYCQHLGDTVVPFPIGGFRALQRLERIASGQLFVLSADKGYTEMHDLTNLDGPQIVHHGSISMMVNYHALGRYMARQGGFMFANSERNAALELVALGTAEPAMLPEAQSAFDQVMEQFGPLDIYELTNAKLAEKATAEQLLAILRASSWDPYTFMTLTERLNASLEDASAGTRRRLRHALKKVWDCYFPLPGGHDLPFELGFLHYRLERFPEAFHFYSESLRYQGDHAVTLHNMALCQYRLGQYKRALQLLDRALGVDANYGPARGWRLRILSELEQEPLLPQEEPLLARVGGDRSES